MWKYTIGDRIIGAFCRATGRVPFTEVQFLGVSSYGGREFYEKQLKRMEDLYGFRLDLPERKRTTCG